MNQHNNTIQQKSVEWLLEEENPSVRYFTLLDILGRRKSSPDMTKSRSQIMKIGPVPKILSSQRPDGYWGKPEDFYVRSKYKGTVWSFLLLAELAADGQDACIKKACEFILEYSQDRKGGGFSIHGNAEYGGQHSKVIPCLTGNIVWSLIRFGYINDSRIGQAVDWMNTCQRFDDGDGPPTNKSPDKACWGKHTCHIGVVKVLKALAEIPPGKRTRKTKETIDKGVEYLLKHRIYKRSHDLRRLAKADWVRFGFPSLWKVDALEMLDILARLGCRDKRMDDAIELVISKRDHLGRWKLESTFNDRMRVRIEQKGKPSKWITLRALRTLKGLHDL